MGKDTTPVDHEAEAQVEAEQAIGAQAGEVIKQIVTLVQADPGFQAAEGAADFFSSSLGPQWGPKHISNVILEDGFRYSFEYFPGGSPERPGTSPRKESIKVLRFDPAKRRAAAADVVVELQTQYDATFVRNPLSETGKVREVSRTYKTGSITVIDRTESATGVHKNSPAALDRIPQVLPFLRPVFPRPVNRPVHRAVA